MTSAAVSSPTTTRDLLGPLTTTFTPPQECTIFGGAGYSDGINGFWAAQGCSQATIIDTATCWPPVAPSVTVPGPPFEGLGFYSPGLVCPSGYSTACTSAVLSNGVPSPILQGKSFSFGYALEAGETAIGCCPSGLSCQSVNGVQTCLSVATSTAFQIGLCGSTAYDTLYSIAIPGSFAYTDANGDTITTSAPATTTFYGPLVQLVWKSSDLSPAVSTSQSQSTLAPSSQSPMSIVSSPTPASTPAPASQDSSLSSGGKIAIGVAVPLGILALTFLIAFSWFRIRKLRRLQRHEPMPMRLDPKPLDKPNSDKYPNPGTGFLPGTEIEGSHAAYELAPAKSRLTGRHELTGTEVSTQR